MTVTSARRRTAGLTGAAAAVVAAVALTPLAGPAGALGHPRPVVGTSGSESHAATTALDEREQARTAPTGAVAPGAYAHAASQLAALPTTTLGAHSLTTGVPYNSDDPRYADPNASNSGGGAGFVTGRIQGVAVSGDALYAGGAAGGVFRSTDGGTAWTPISDGAAGLPALSTGVLRTYAGALWDATGDGTTGGGTFAGNGVWAAAAPAAGTVSWAQVGGTELDGTIIRGLTFDAAQHTVFAATSTGLYRHADTITSSPWTKVLAPCAGVGTTAVDCSATNSNYRDIANDVVVDPADSSHLLANVAWRNGAAYNGFYESHDGGTSWSLTNPTGALSPKDVGNTTFGYTATGGRLYAAVESPAALTSGDATSLGGVYVSKSGTVAGPWTLATNSSQLATTGSAEKPTTIGKGYQPGVQAWYNQFLGVDPANPDHVYLGLEEVYESWDGGNTWTTIGRYWNFGFKCQTSASCDGNVTHSDQHAIAFGDPASAVTRGKVYVGNDGGLYARDNSPSAASWTSLSRSGSLDTLQYYSVAVGTDTTPGTHGVDVWGGLQDNGVSLLRASDPATQVSPFGGDGGRQLTNPANGCQTVGEYVYLSLSLTLNCGASNGSTTAITPIAPADDNPRFIAPFSADAKTPNSYWVAGGHYVWANTKTWASTGSSDWTQLGATPGSTTAVDSYGRTVWAGWCGGCNPGSSFHSGLVSTVGGTFHTVAPDTTSTPKRMITDVKVDPTDPSSAYVVFGGFSRNWVSGPGGYAAGLGHVFRVTDHGDGTATWVDLSANMPDIPASSVQVNPDGTLLVGTDLGLLVRSAGPGGTFSRVADIPLTQVSQTLTGPDGKLYVSTFGRGLYVAPTSG